MFDKMPEKDEFTWNTMIAAYANGGRFVEARQVFEETQSAYVGGLLRMCALKGLLSRGEQIHGYSIKTCFDMNVFVMTGLIDMYAKCKRIFEAECIFLIMSHGKNHVTWTAMINGYSQNGDALRAIRCFSSMHAEGIEANQYTFPGVLTSCAALSDIRFGVQIHSCIVNGGFDANVFVQSSLIDMYAKCGDLPKDAKNGKCLHCLVLKTDMRATSFMVEKDVISWTSLVTGCAHNGSYEEALKLFREMRMAEIKQDQIIIASVLSSCSELALLELGQQIHADFIKSGLDASLSVDNSLK
ncbi:hypothetical protein HAX54_023827 [Datura stramonium]|uniref:Pentatricopeptide repeat-containing protein n=1 Tax=Datura stramonium TaxID=4076 RepID=A0ABS8UX39_DATST|nr:hypothetical protein [Datura stramonium]